MVAESEDLIILAALVSAFASLALSKTWDYFFPKVNGFLGIVIFILVLLVVPLVVSVIIFLVLEKMFFKKSAN
jgi:hypothetical protein